jgi:hypothetical protein
VYTAAAVGVVHHLATNRQSFFQGHTDDISALTVNDAGTLAASGTTSSIFNLASESDRNLGL